ncbi:MAG: spore coat protein [Euryarchaeota archaeon]|nr:spore coat protein [Euryarchaeota archaeon]|tara:strand:- start:1496 stop:2275 length:780 start_codon:yes stop_codon:yes gene_type:complete
MAKSSDICGVVLAGGWGTRLMPLTTSTNKHLLPVYDEPMICKSIATLARMGIKEIMIVLGGYSGNSFFALLGDGHRFGLDIRYAYQEQAGGIAEALRLTKGFVGKRNVAVILGDNVFQQSMKSYADEFVKDEEHDCYLFLKPVNDPGSFGIAWIDENGRIVNMEEKPSVSDSNLAITGLYMYTPRVYDMIEEIITTTGYSSRGELEITDINRLFMQKNLAKGCHFDSHWADCGTVDALLETSVLMKEWDLGPWLQKTGE